jgi:hypothetical protein
MKAYLIMALAIPADDAPERRAGVPANQGFGLSAIQYGWPKMADAMLEAGQLS